MKTVVVEDIERTVLDCLREVEAGQTVVILRGGLPVAEIRPLSPSSRSLRPFGLCAGEFTVPDDFDEPMPDEFLKSFEDP